MLEVDCTLTRVPFMLCWDLELETRTPHLTDFFQGITEGRRQQFRGV